MSLSKQKYMDGCQVMGDFLQDVYSAAGVVIPTQFDPHSEAQNIVTILRVQGKNEKTSLVDLNGQAL
jgi:hypothetical protein